MLFLSWGAIFFVFLVTTVKELGILLELIGDVHVWCV